MLRRLPQHIEVQHTLTIAADILGEDPYQLDLSEALQLSRNVQVALFLCGVASARVLMAKGHHAEFTAGLSIGAFAAAVASGAVSFEDLLPVVALRGELMDRAYPKDYGMMAIHGLTAHQVQILVDKENSVNHPVFVANLNAPRQIVIAGSNVAMEAIAASAHALGIGASTQRLDVKAPSHGPLLQGVADRLRKELDTLSINAPRIGYLSNVRTRVLYDADGIRQDLASNVAHRVDWYKSVELLKEYDVDLFVEMRPGDVLSRLDASSPHPGRWLILESKR
jgi:malonate decarboxylase epsilon subunit